MLLLVPDGSGGERAAADQEPASDLSNLADLPAPEGGAPEPAPPRADPARARPAPPERIEVPAAGVDVGLTPVSAGGGPIEVPPADEAGWFSEGPRPGEPGHAVVVGHVDTLDGPAVFGELRALERGDGIEVTDGRGDQHDYDVVGTAEVLKDRFPTRAVYSRSSSPVLVLVTCDGEFDPQTGYEKNLLVFARSA